MFLVTETDYDYFGVHGLFSTQEKAEAYIKMVDDANKTAKTAGGGYLDFEEIELDELDGIFPVFAMSASHGDVGTNQVMFLREMPETELRDSNGVVFSIKTHGRTPAEARAKMLALKADYPDLTRKVR